MTFKSLWLMIRTTWQSRPFAILLPLAALGWFFFTHGHDWKHPVASHSIPTWQEWMTLAALFATKGERLTEFLFGAPSPASLPAPVKDPVIAPKVGAVLLLLGLGFALQACAHVDAVAKDVTGCVKADEPSAVVDLEKAAPKIVEDILMCAPGGEAAIPMCVEQGLQSLVVALGPDGERFRLCVVNAIENDPEAAPLAKQRAKAVRVKLLRQASSGGLLLDMAVLGAANARLTSLALGGR